MLAEVAAREGLYPDAAPSLDELADEYGEHNDRSFWPVIRVQVSPETKAAYDALMRTLPGADEAEKFDALIGQAGQ
jgi:hypothetical protein